MVGSAVATMVWSRAPRNIASIMPRTMVRISGWVSRRGSGGGSGLAVRGLTSGFASDFASGLAGVLLSGLGFAGALASEFGSDLTSGFACASSLTEWGLVAGSLSSGSGFAFGFPVVIRELGSAAGAKIQGVRAKIQFKRSLS